ncbi:hypothetical protein VTO73DRAFT_3660 [Trametes versicolor]
MVKFGKRAPCIWCFADHRASLPLPPPLLNALQALLGVPPDGAFNRASPLFPSFALDAPYRPRPAGLLQAPAAPANTSG